MTKTRWGSVVRASETTAAPVFEDPDLKDFRNFLYLVWEFLGLPEPTVAQYEMADALQNVFKPLLGLPVDPEFRLNYPQFWDDEKDCPDQRVILSAFRGVGKSWITAALVIWCLAWSPSLNFMVVAGSGAKSEEFSSFVKRLITEMPLLALLKADQSRGQRWSYVAFDVGPAGISQAASVRSASITGTLTGGRANAIIADDVETPNTSETQTMRTKLGERVKEFDAILSPGGIICYLGTPQCEDSTYRHLETRGFRKIIWPARYPGEKWVKANGYALAKSVADRMTADPALTTGYGLDGQSGAPVDSRFTEEDLLGREASYGRSGFGLQFMLDTSLADTDRYPLKLRDLIVTDLDPMAALERPRWSSAAEARIKDLPVVGLQGDGFYREASGGGGVVPYTGAIMAVDPAGRGKDEMAYCVVKECAGYFYLLAIGGIKGTGYDDTALEKLAHVAKQFGVNKLLVETNFGDGMFEALLRPVLRNIYPVTIESVRHSTQKEKRIIQTLEPVMNQHRLITSPSVIRSDAVRHPDDSVEDAIHRQLFHQMTRVTLSRGSLRFDDRLDVLAIAIAAFAEAAAQDVDRKVEERNRRLFLERVAEIQKSSARLGQRARDHIEPRRNTMDLGFFK